jgi:hypothetical protein
MKPWHFGTIVVLIGVYILGAAYPGGWTWLRSKF